MSLWICMNWQRMRLWQSEYVWWLLEDYGSLIYLNTFDESCPACPVWNSNVFDVSALFSKWFLSGWDSGCHQDDRLGCSEKLWAANCSMGVYEFPLTTRACDDVLSPIDPNCCCSKLWKCPLFRFVPSIVPMYSLRTEDMAGFDQEVATLSKCDAWIASFTFKVKCESC